MKKRILAALLVFVALLTGCSRKETTGQWPSQKIEIDVCYTAGGTADTVARQLSALMSQQLSTTFNLVNVTGGSGSIAGHCQKKLKKLWLLKFHWAAWLMLKKWQL